MKLSFLNPRINSRVVNISIVLCVLVFLVSLLSLVFMKPMRHSITAGIDHSIHVSKGSSYLIDRSLEPIDPIVSDAIPHKQYRRIVDSLKLNRMMKNGTLSGSSSQSIFIGATSLERCESCSIWDNNDRRKTNEHFIMLKWWTLDTIGKLEPVKYHVKNGKPYLRKMICKPKDSSKKVNTQYLCNEVDEPIPFRYDTSDKYMLIPSNEITVNILNVLCLSFMIVLIIYVFYYIMGGFIKILLDIASGMPFSDKNVLRLKIITLSFLLIPLVLFLLNLLMRLVFYRYFTDDIKLSPEAWAFLWKPWVFSVIFAALYLAFKKGKELKEEQDLTV